MRIPTVMLTLETKYWFDLATVQMASANMHSALGDCIKNPSPKHGFQNSLDRLK